MNLLLNVTTIDTVLLYVIMGVLLLGNLIFIILFVWSVARNNTLEEKYGQTLKNDLEKATAHDKTTTQPIGARAEDINLSEYKVVPARDKIGWYVIKKSDKSQIAYAQDKLEADEILKNIVRNS